MRRYVSSYLKMIVVTLAVVTALANMPTYNTFAQSLQSDTDITLIPGKLELTEVPSFSFVLYRDDYSRGSGANLQGAISGNFVVEDARLTGKSWILKVSMGDFIERNGQKNTKLSNISLDLSAPQNVSMNDPTNTFTGYPTSIVAGSNEYKTIAISLPNNRNTLFRLEGTIPDARLTVPRSQIKSADKYNYSVYETQMYWSIEDAP